MRFCIRDHQGKGEPLHRALVEAGHTETLWHQRNEVVLIDYDLPHWAYDSWVSVSRTHNAPLVVYPHGFSATWAWDLVETPIEAAATLVPGPGQKHLLEAYDYPNPVHVIGWPAPEPSDHFDGILFAPHHPLGSGYMQPDSMQANAEAFRVLLEEDAPLTVRYIGTLEQNGLWHEEDVRYVPGSMGGAFQTADVVVARGTYAANCLSAGANVVTYDQDADWRLEAEDAELVRYPKGWREHRDFTRYPYDLAEGVCGHADAHSSEVARWRERFMPPFDPEAFVRVVEETVETKTGALA